MTDADELIDYEEDEVLQTPAKITKETAATKDATASKDSKKGTYVGIHSTGFRDFLLKPELLRAIVDCGFEHPSEGTYKFLSSFSLSLSMNVFITISK